MFNERLIDRRQFLHRVPEDIPFYTSREYSLKEVTINNQRRLYAIPKDHSIHEFPKETTFGQIGVYPQNRLPIQKPILGLDTETIEGKCRLLCDSKGNSLDMFKLSDFLEFIELHEYNKTINLFFNLHYDAQSILTYLPNEILFDLHIFNEVVYDDITIRYIPRKKLSFRYNKKNYHFFDIFQFYLTSLDKASAKYIGERKIEFDLTQINDPQFWIDNYTEIIEYCVKDAVLCGKLGRLSKAQYNKLGLDFNSPISSASMAEQFAIRYRSIPRYSLPFIQEYGYYSYWGGWFEQFRRGYFEQAYKPDMNSAYPAVMSQLPDISQGVWELHTTNLEDCTFGFVFVKIRSNYNYIQPLPTAWTGSLKFPVLDWHYRYLTVDEYRYYRDNELAEMIIIDVALFFPYTDYKPFAYMESFYKRRLEMKKDEDPRQLPLKIMMNSTYGKLIQMIEVVKENWKLVAGQMFLPVYASYITALTRLELLKFVHKRDIKPIAFYTDCVVMEDNPNVNSTQLGGWNIENKGEMIAIGCGVYSIRDGDKESSHIRGFHRSSDRSLFNLVEANLSRSYIPMDIVKPISLGEFIRRFKDTSENMLNEWINFPKQINLNFDSKRIWENDFTNAKDLMSRNMDSKPFDLR